ncbi:MAG TPA: alpha/beta hydrolase [Chloroflexota bacterium]
MTAAAWRRSRAGPTGAVRCYRRTDNQLRHYDRLARWPERFVVTGDAVCAFNPIYGQGMTVAALDAAALDACLREQERSATAGDLIGLATRFQKRLARTVAAPWLVATGEDLRYPTTEGGRPSPATRLVQRYMNRVVSVATEDAPVFEAFSDVVNMLAPPSRLFRPSILRRVLAGLREPPLVEPPVAETGEVAARPLVATTAAALDGRLDAVDGYAELGDVRLHYVEAGRGPLVVLLHGFPEFWYSWRHQIRALAGAGFRVVAPDMRGYNLSDKPPGVAAYDLDALVEDVARLIRERGAERAVVVGHDWGGGVAWAFAMRHPEMLERLVVLNCPHPARLFDGLRTLRQLRKSWYMFFFQLPRLPEASMRSGDFALLRRTLRADAARPDAFGAEDVERYVAALSQPGALTGGINYCRAMFRRSPARRRGAIRPITAPVLVVWGERDRYLGPELAEPDPTLVPNARVERLPDASHWAQVDRPERVNALLLDFLADLRPAGPAPAAPSAERP